MANLFAENEMHLTVINPELESARARTVAGMAHFAGTRPVSATCRECTFWTGCGDGAGYAAKRGMSGGEIKPRACAMFKKLMSGVVGGKIKHTAAACKYFEANPMPPPAFEKGS